MSIFEDKIWDLYHTQIMNEGGAVDLRSNHTIETIADIKTRDLMEKLAEEAFEKENRNDT